MSNKQDTSVRVYSSDDCPSKIKNVYTEVRDAFNACIAGYGLVNISSVIVDENGVATIITAQNHNFFIGEVIEILGSDNTALNTVWKIDVIVSSDTFKILTDFPAGTITGTMQVKVAPLTYLSYNGSVFNIQAIGQTFSFASYPSTGIQVTATNFGGQLEYFKYTDQTSTNKKWWLIAGPKIIYFVIKPGNGYVYGFFLGVISPLRSTFDVSPDNCNIFYAVGGSDLLESSSICSLTRQRYISGSYAGTVGLTTCTFFNPFEYNFNLEYAGITSSFLAANTGINPVTQQRVYLPIHVKDATAGIRGYLPGVYTQIGAAPADGIYIDGAKKMLHFWQNNRGFCFDISGAW